MRLSDLLGVVSLARCFIFLPAIVGPPAFYIAYAFELMLFVVRSKLQVSASRVFFGLIFFMLLVLVQSQYGLTGLEVFSSVTDPQYKIAENSTLGLYPVGGHVNFLNFLKFIFFGFYSFILYQNLVASRVAYDFSLKVLLYFSVSLSLVLLISCDLFLLGGYFHALSGNAPNFLTTDEYGTRISAGLYEPSLFAVLIVPIVISLIFLNKQLRKTLLCFFILLLLLFITRSASLLMLAVLLYCILKFDKLYTYAFWMAAVLVLLFRDIVVKYLSENVFIFRSINERLAMPYVDLASPTFYFGVDFGQVTSFVPLLGLFLQVGLAGVMVFFCLLRLNIKTFSVFVLLCAVSPRLWYYEQLVGFTFILALGYWQKENSIFYSRFRSKFNLVARSN